MVEFLSVKPDTTGHLSLLSLSGLITYKLKALASTDT